ncbi:MAG TPA: hypothetical protein VGG23_04345, partial [Acidimicrobiales bacterium]
LLVLQAYALAARELQVPRFVLRAIEEHLAESGVSVTFGRAAFDPFGRILIEKAKFRLASFAEPVVTADAIFIRVDPIALMERRFEPRQVRATGANLYIPAMLSPSGRPEKVIEDLDAGFSIASRGDEFTVDYLNCRLAGVDLSASGTVNTGNAAKRQAAPTSVPLAEFVSRNYVALSREFAHVEETMAGLDHPAVTAVLTASEKGGAIVHAQLSAVAVRLAAPVAVEARGLTAEARFPLLGSGAVSTSVTVMADAVAVAGKVRADGIIARAGGTLRMDTLAFEPRQLDLRARSIAWNGIEAVAPFVHVVPRTGTALSGGVSAFLFGQPTRVTGQVDRGAGTADVVFTGALTPDLLGAASGLLHTDIRRFADLTEPFAASGRIRLSAGWKIADATVHIDGRTFTAYHVPFEEARGDISYDGVHLAAREAGDDVGDGDVVVDQGDLEARPVERDAVDPHAGVRPHVQAHVLS